MSKITEPKTNKNNNSNSDKVIYLFALIVYTNDSRGTFLVQLLNVVSGGIL